MVEHLIAGGDPVGALHRIVSDRRQHDSIIKPQVRGGALVTSFGADAKLDLDRLMIEAGVVGDQCMEFTTEDWDAIGRNLRATGRKTDLRAARVLDAWLSSGGSKEEMGLADYVFLRRQLGKPSRLVTLIRNTVTGNASQPAPDRSGPSSAMPPRTVYREMPSTWTHRYHGPELRHYGEGSISALPIVFEKKDVTDAPWRGY